MKESLLTDLEKFQLVNSCETVVELEKAIHECSNSMLQIEGKTKMFDAEKMISQVSKVVNGELYASCLTRNWGIRQQALYLAYYHQSIPEIGEVDLLNDI